MDRSIERSQLKKNFLNEIIMRLDFQGVLQAEMEKVILEAKPYLKGKSFNRYNENINNQAVIEGVSVKEASSQIEYCFTAETTGYTLKLSNTSIIMSVRTAGYAPFEDYSEIFAHIAAIYQEKIDFFTVKRFGLRKINYCFVKRMEDIEVYFDSKYYCCHEPITGYSTMAINRTSQLTDGRKNLNLKFAVDQGEIEKEAYYRVTLDADIYSVDEETITSIITDKEQMMATNETLFKVYCSVIAEPLYNILSSDDDNIPDGLAGIENNE